MQNSVKGNKLSDLAVFLRFSSRSSDNPIGSTILVLGISQGYFKTNSKMDRARSLFVTIFE